MFSRSATHFLVSHLAAIEANGMYCAGICREPKQVSGSAEDFDK
jgi:hypothetical protein